MKRRSLGVVLVWLTLTGVASASEPRLNATFAKKPAVIKVDDKWKIDFAVDHETDVAVSIEDAGGNVVRHLVAGSAGQECAVAAQVRHSGKPAGPGAATASEIPFAWPQAVAVGNGYVYVGDRVNRRIVRVKLEHAASETVAIP